MRYTVQFRSISRRALQLRYNSSSSSNNSNSRGPVTFASLGLMLFVGGSLLTYYNEQKDEKMRKVTKQTTTIGRPALGGPWMLVDENGRSRTDVDFHGKFALLYFGFTYCPDICPSELVKIGKIMDALERRNCAVVKPIFISVDPSRDTIGQLRFYKQDFHPDVTYLTGTKDQIAAAAKAYRVYFSKAIDVDADSEEDYLVDHSIVLYLVNPKGEFVDFFTQRMEIADIVDKIVKYAAEDKLLNKKT